MRIGIAVLLLCATGIVAAPVPKDRAKKPVPAGPDGLWQVTSASHWNGKLQFNVVGCFYRIEGEAISDLLSPDTPPEKCIVQNGLVRDPDQPRLRLLVVGGVPPPQPGPPPKRTVYSALVEVDGDTLRFAYVCDERKQLTACAPADDVYYYELKRVPESR